MIKEKRATLLLIARNPHIVRINAAIQEHNELREVRVGDRATFVVAALPGHVFSGEVIQISMLSPDRRDKRAYEIVLAAPNPNLLLEPGMHTMIKIPE